MDAVLPGYRNQPASYRLRVYFSLQSVSIIANVTRHVFILIKFPSLYSFSQAKIIHIFMCILFRRYTQSCLWVAPFRNCESQPKNVSWMFGMYIYYYTARQCDSFYTFDSVVLHLTCKSPLFYTRTCATSAFYKEPVEADGGVTYIFIIIKWLS